MGVADWVVPIQSRITEAARVFFEPSLAGLGLGQNEISSQTLPQLRESLDRVNECIGRAESFGVVKLRADANGRFVVSTTDPQIEIGITPVLLERKKLIVERMGILLGEEKVGDLRTVAERADPSVRKELDAKINELEAEVRSSREQTLAIEEAERRVEIDHQLQITRVEAFERRSRVWQSFLERQSVATMVGALLLVMMFAFIAVASAVVIPVPELIANAFLVILGYFFGQASHGTNPA